MKRRWYLVGPGAVLLVMAAAARLAFEVPHNGPEARLQATMADVAHRWPDIAHVPAHHVAQRLVDESIVLFDVRQEDEYKVSHIPGARRVDPSMSRSDFIARYGDGVTGKTVVFYCSVGMRSSKLAQRVTGELKERGAADVVDLAGGIFAWHSEARPLVDAGGRTPFVHPYDKIWGQLVARQDLTRTEPRVN